MDKNNKDNFENKDNNDFENLNEFNSDSDEKNLDLGDFQDDYQELFYETENRPTDDDEDYEKDFDYFDEDFKDEEINSENFPQENEEERTEYEEDDFDDDKNEANSKRKNWLFSGINEEDNSRPVDYKKFTRDLTKEAYQGQLDPVIGREKEIKRLIQILSRRTKNNPVIVGEPGVGKTAVVEGLAQRIASYDVPDNLVSSRIIMLDIGALIAGTRYRGEFEERLRFIIDKVQKSPKRILFIDEIHTLIGAGSAEGTMDAANMLKPVLARGNFRCIGATTTKEYKKYIERDPALERRFQPIVVDPPSVPDTVVILAGLRRAYECYHDVLITNEALLAAAKYSDQYVPDRFLPDKAIDVIDEACAQVKLEAVKTPDSIKSYTRELNALLLEKDKLIRQQNYYMAAKIYEKERQLRALIKSSIKKSSNSDIKKS
jgi:ATP-dependent Clp protease ATP-binding subunit ClpC